MNNYIHGFQWGVITYPYLNFNTGLNVPAVKLMFLIKKGPVAV